MTSSLSRIRTWQDHRYSSNFMAHKKTLLSLDEDILSKIIARISPADAIHLSATTKILHSIALRHALSLAPNYSFYDVHGFKTFCLFILADPDARCRWMRHFRVPLYAYLCLGGQRLSGLVVDLFDKLRVGGLQHLVIDNFHNIFNVEPGIADAITALPSLVDLSLYGLMEHELHLVVGRLQNQLRKLSLSFKHIVSAEVVLPLLEPMQCLATLLVQGMSFNSPPGLSQTPNLPSVRHLTLRPKRFDSETCPMSTAVKAFPCLKTLCIQQNESCSQPEDSSCWSSLDRLSGDASSLITWRSMTCSVYCLDVEMTRDSLERALTFWHTMPWQTLAPIVLSLKVNFEFLSDPTFCAGLTESMHATKCLEMCVHDRIDDSPRMNIIIPALAASRALVCIQVYMVDPFRTLHGESRSSSSWLPEELAQNISSVQYLAIGNRKWKGGTMWFGKISWFRAVRDGQSAQCSVVPIREAVGEWLYTQMHTPGCDFHSLTKYDVLSPAPAG